MYSTLNASLEDLNNLVVENLEQVRLNAIEINLITNLPDSENKKRLLREKFTSNKELLYKNIVHMEEQLKLAKLLSISKNKLNKNPEINSSQFYEIISGNQTFDENHPNFQNITLVSMLIEYYRHHDDIEKCLQLRKQLKKIKQN